MGDTFVPVVAPPCSPVCESIRIRSSGLVAVCVKDGRCRFMLEVLSSSDKMENEKLG